MNGTELARISRTEQGLAWVLLIAGLAVAAVGNTVGWAQRFVWFDELMHFGNGFAVTLVLALHLYANALLPLARGAVLLVLTIMVLGVGLGGLWEIAEWMVDQLLIPGNAIKGKTDTIVDLMLDTVGALLAGVLAVRLARS